MKFSQESSRNGDRGESSSIVVMTSISEFEVRRYSEISISYRGSSPSKVSRFSKRQLRSEQAIEFNIKLRFI